MLIRTALVTGLLVGSAGLALADSDKLPAGAISTAQVTTQLQAQGYKISKIEADDGQYKVKGFDASGQKLKLKVNALTGAVISKDIDD